MTKTITLTGYLVNMAIYIFILYDLYHRLRYGGDILVPLILLVAWSSWRRTFVTQLLFKELIVNLRTNSTQIAAVLQDAEKDRTILTNKVHEEIELARRARPPQISYLN